MGLLWICTYWRLLLIGTLFGLLALQTWRLDQKTEDLNKIKILTDEARNQSDSTIERLREAIPDMVKIAQGNAVTNYKQRFGSCPVGNGIRADSVLSYGNSEAGSSQGTNETHKPEPLACDPATLEAAAVDAVMLEAWKDWARSNGLKEK